METYHGYLHSTRDALLLVEACRLGLLRRVSRRLTVAERRAIRSGSIFVFDESEARIKRWTDGRLWSPSRILDNFLVYREVSSKQPLTLGDPSAGFTPLDHRAPPNTKTAVTQPDVDQAPLLGKRGTFHFAKDGLVKKTISVQVHGVPHHVVAYYSRVDIAGQQPRLKRPAADPQLLNVSLSSCLLTQTAFRCPVSPTPTPQPPVDTMPPMMPPPSLPPPSQNLVTMASLPPPKKRHIFPYALYPPVTDQDLDASIQLPKLRRITVSSLLLHTNDDDAAFANSTQRSSPSSSHASSFGI